MHQGHSFSNFGSLVQGVDTLLGIYGKMIALASISDYNCILFITCIYVYLQRISVRLGSHAESIVIILWLSSYTHKRDGLSASCQTV